MRVWLECESQASSSVAILKSFLPFLLGTSGLWCCTKTPFLHKVLSPVTWQGQVQLFPGCTKPPSPQRCHSHVLGEGSRLRVSLIWGYQKKEGGNRPASPGLHLASTALTNRGAQQRPFTPPGTVHWNQLALHRKENRSRPCSDGSPISRPSSQGAIVLWLCPFHRPFHAAW